MLEPGSPVVIGVMPGLRPAVVECASEIAELLGGRIYAVYADAGSYSPSEGRLAGVDPDSFRGGRRVSRRAEERDRIPAGAGRPTPAAMRIFSLSGIEGAAPPKRPFRDRGARVGANGCLLRRKRRAQCARKNNAQRHAVPSQGS